MIRKKGKAARVAIQIMKGKGIRVQAGTKEQQKPLTTPYLQH